MTRVICIGECMVERRQDGAEAFAGDAFNVAAHIKRCAPALDVAFASSTGDDPESGRMRLAWRALGVDDSLSPVIPGGRIGRYRVDVDGAGEHRFTYDRSRSAARRWHEVLKPRAEALAGADLLFLSGVSLAILPPAERVAALAFVVGLKAKRLAFDPNLRPALWEGETAMRTSIGGAVAVSDILLPSLDDLRLLWGDAPAASLFEQCRASGAREVALTLAADGCLVAHGGADPIRIAASHREVVDTAGAGDAFDGAYLAARLTGTTPEDAAKAGLARAADVIAHAGALPTELFPCP